MQTIADCLGDVGAILIYQRDDGSYGTIGSPALDAARLEYDRDEWWRHDIRFSRSVPRGFFASTDAITERDIATPEEIETLPFYAQFLRGHGLKWFGAVSISPDPHVAAALSVQRSQDKPSFSDDELAVIARLGRHVENALRLGVRLINAEASQQALTDVLARLGVGVFLLDAVGRVIFANPAAEQISGDGLLVAQGRLTARVASCQEALRAAIARASLDDAATLSAPPQRVLIPGQELGGFLAVHILPVRAVPGGGVENLLIDVSAIAVVTSAQPGEPADPALVRDLFGLTLAEARIAALIGAGLAPRNASLALGISEETARTTLKRVFAKVGVSRQSELTALLTKLSLR
ncbi:helix-turn-helix transcriptional regulator [Bosea caraganae]|uniref:Helix-turn-helix transcriptional regulator n=1 Tax=Bosea caraganae TaxID=2763117 RepID=A0A370LC29_9HYPH|nr:PAS domain-containing protein [Bosea caraganae]RDJ27511.1 helix-turn-helix transcriptional regulator [Bosea caraganae]RDJ29526.1 helix-turn-helix transcriptional regulator [Bosea caraganae]